MNKLVSFLKIIVLIGLIVYISIINWQSYKSRVDYSDKLYSVQVYDGRVLVRSTVVNKYPIIKNNTITLPNNQNKPIEYKDVRIEINEIKELD